MKTTLYLVRHAEAAGNLAKTFQGHTDAVVTEKGMQQLAGLAERFCSLPCDVLYTSPLLRARQTAQAVNQYHQLPILIEPGLIEINGGLFEGLRWDEIPLLYPEAYDKWQNAPHLFKAPQGESMADVFDRMENTLNRIARANQGKTVCAVSHGVAIRAFLCYAHGWSRERLRDLMWEENTSICTITYDDQFCPHVVAQNDASHLTHEACSLAHQDWWKSTITNGEQMK